MIATMKTIKGYHFTGTTLRDGRPLPKVGTWLRHKGDVIPCEVGLHMSVEPFDALRFAPGPLLHRVELRGDLQSHGSPVDKWAGRERRIIASLDARETLRFFARMCAVSVAHYWDAPDVVLDFLMSGDEGLRDAAQAATWDAAQAAGWDAALDAGWDAVRAAARAAAGAAAWDAAGAAQADQLRKMIPNPFAMKEGAK